MVQLNRCLLHHYLLVLSVTFSILMQFSTLYGHTVLPEHSDTHNMTSEYVTTSVGADGRETHEITDKGYIDLDNIGQMKFTFGTPNDITESLNKRTGGDIGSQSTIKKGRVGYSRASCTYPDGSVTEQVIVTNCIIHYRQKMTGGYGDSYITVGIPTAYVNRILVEAKKTINVVVPAKFQEKNGCYWFNCKIDKLTKDNTWVVYTDAEGDLAGATGILKQVLGDMESSIVVTARFVIAASMATESVDQKLDMTNGVFNLSFSVTEVFLQKKTNIEGPTLDTIQRQEKETTEKHEKLLASDELASYAMTRLTINS